MHNADLNNAQQAMDNASSYLKWSEAAQEHDSLSGMLDWKQTNDNDLYDCHLLRDQYQAIESSINKADDFKLMHRLNEGLHGNLGGMGKAALYQQAKFGTKNQINDYIQLILNALDRVAQSDDPRLTLLKKLDFFKRANQCYGRAALLLSGGATQGIFHIGVVRALYEQGLLPSILSGSSAGSLIAAVICTKDDNELQALFSKDSLRLETMKFLGWGNLLKGQPLMDSEHLELAMATHIDDLTFEEAFEKTQRKLNITISPAMQHHESRMLNEISSPSVHIRKGVLASCAAPGLFSPVTLTQKNAEGEPEPYNASRQWVDGTITDDLPTKRLSRLYGVNYYIASQTNPHIVPFIKEKSVKKTIPSTIIHASTKTTKQVLSAIATLGREKVTSPTVGLALSHIHAMLTQDYGADITIYPSLKFSNPVKLFKDPSKENFAAMILEGERATWPKIEMIRNSTIISNKLDAIVTQLEKQEEQLITSGSKSHVIQLTNR